MGREMLLLEILLSFISYSHSEVKVLSFISL